MGYIEHKHGDNCQSYSFEGWLPHVAPDFLWFNIHDVGDYQGRVYGVALYDKKIVVYEDYYGSCSGCGAWGEGGEPENQKLVIANSTPFELADEAIAYLAKIDRYEGPNIEDMTKAIREADDFRNKGESAK